MTSFRFVGASMAVAALTLAACGSSDADDATSATNTASVAPPAAPATDEPAAPIAETGSEDEQRFPDIIGATATTSNGLWTFQVTVSSPYDSPDRYADGWRIVGPDGTEYGFRLLTHDHASEQPFTRSLSDVQIPEGVEVVTIEGRDQVHGFGGATLEFSLPTG